MPSRDVIAATRAAVGRTLRGKWRLDALLGVGGSAAVYAATHRNGKRGAVKLLRADLAGDDEVRERFLREGYVANLVGHPGAVAMLDDDVDEDGAPFLVMELLAGETLERVIRARRSMPLREVLRIAESLLDVLAAAHVHGIVHGDIKPGNVFITCGGDVKLVDFGIARVSSESVPTGEALGTPAYMSPEQARGDAVDGRADVWAVGALMFALITGKKPRRGSSLGDALLMATSDPMPRLANVAPELGREISDVVDRALAFDRDARWPDATTMQQALRLALLLEQASGPAEAGLQVPLTIARERGEERTRTDVRIFKPSETRGARSTSSLATATPAAMVSSLPPGPNTGHRLAFAASLPPPEGEAHVPAPTQKRASPRAPAVLSAAVVVLGIAIGLAFTGGPSLGLASESSHLGAPTAAHDGGADAADASK